MIDTIIAVFLILSFSITWIIAINILSHYVTKNSLFRFFLTCFVVLFLFYFPLFYMNNRDFRVEEFDPNSQPNVEVISQWQIKVFLFFYLGNIVIIPILLFAYRVLITRSYKNHRKHFHYIIRHKSVFTVFFISLALLSAFFYYKSFIGNYDKECLWSKESHLLGGTNFYGALNSQEVAFFLNYDYSFYATGITNEYVFGTWDYDKEKDKMTLLFEEVSKVMESKFEKNESWNTEEKKLILDVESDSCDYEGIKLTGDDLTLDYYKVSF